MIKIAVVDDHCLFRRGLVLLINNFDELEVVIEASDGRKLIQRIIKQNPDVVLMDVEMPNMDGFEATEYLKKNHPEIKILIISMHNDEAIIQHLISAGAHGFLLKNNDVDVMVDAIYAVMENGYFFNDYVSKDMIKMLVSNKNIKPSFNSVVLSDREIEVVKLICRERSNKEIANQLCISVRTVDGHRERILEKIKAKNTAGIVMYAIQNNLIPLIPKSKTS